MATAYNGLWRIVEGRALRTHFPEKHITSLAVTRRGLEITSADTLYRRQGRDRFQKVAAVAAPQAPPIFTSAVTAGRDLLAGAFDGGLYRLTPQGAEPLEYGLTVEQRRINALAYIAEELWVASEGGLLRLSIGADALGRPPEVVLERAVHALTETPHGLVAATSRGLYLVGYDGRPMPLGSQSAAASSSFGAVAWLGGELYAGGLEGLFRLRGGDLEPVGRGEGFDGGWVTALLADGDGLWVGTYDRGVYSLRDGRFTPVPGLEHQWVPPGALARLGTDLWVGGLGMNPVRVRADGRTERLELPVRDVNAFLPGFTGEVILLTSEGAMTVSQPPVRNRPGVLTAKR